MTGNGTDMAQHPAGGMPIAPSETPHAGYRPCVGMVLANRSGRVFLGRRLPGSGQEKTDPAYAWQLPQGGIDPGETPYEAALRELFEETGIRSVSLLGEAPHWYAYDLPGKIAGQAWKGKWRGQTQKWLALRFEGEDDEINVEAPGDGTYKAEFEAWKWEALERAPDLVIPFKRPVYEQVVRALGPLVAG